MTQHGKDTGICLGEFDITRWLNEVSGDRSIDAADASCFDEPKGAKVYVAGLNDGTFSWSGREQGKVTDTNVRQTFEGIAALEAGVPFTVGIQRGFHPGRLAEMGNVLVTSANVSAPVSDVVSVSGDLQSDGPIYTGKVLTQKAPYDGAATNGTTVDYLTASVGALIHYHVTQNTRNGQVTVTVQDSTNGTLWVDVDQFQVAAGEILSEATIVTTGLDRYVRVVVSLAGTTGTATIRVALADRK